MVRKNSIIKEILISDTILNPRRSTRVTEREEKKWGGGQRRVKSEDGQNSSRGRTEVNQTAVLTYYSKRNQAKLGALLFVLSSPECHIDLRILASLQM